MHGTRVGVLMIDDLFRRVKREGRKFLNVYESLKVLEAYGIPTCKFNLGFSKEEVLKSCLSIGFPVVLKLVSNDISHKSDKGFVVVGLSSLSDISKLYDEFVDRAKKLGISFNGVLVEEMVRGVEVFIGGFDDIYFGPVIVFGMGGIYVELFRDVSYGIAPLSEDEALDIIKSTKVYKILSGYRSGKKYDINSLVSFLVKFSRFIYDYAEYISEVDLNPVFVLEKGCKVVDARIVLK